MTGKPDLTQVVTNAKEQMGVVAMSQKIIEHKNFEHKTGGSTPSQYRLDVPYKNGIARELECGDVADTLNLNGNMYEAFKALWRLEDKDGPAYNLNKIIWFARREQLRRGHITQQQFWKYADALVGKNIGINGELNFKQPHEES